MLPYFLFSKPTVLQKYQQVPATSGITNINYKKSTQNKRLTDKRGAYRKKSNSNNKKKTTTTTPLS